MKSHAWAMSSNESPMNTDNSPSRGPSGAAAESATPSCAPVNTHKHDSPLPTPSSSIHVHPIVNQSQGPEASAPLPSDLQDLLLVEEPDADASAPADAAAPVEASDTLLDHPLCVDMSKDAFGGLEPPPMELMRQLESTLQSIRAQQLRDLLAQFSIPCSSDHTDLAALLTATRDLRTRVYTNNTATPLTHTQRRQTLRQIDTLVELLDDDATEGSAGEASLEDDGRTLAPAVQASLQTLRRRRRRLESSWDRFRADTAMRWEWLQVRTQQLNRSIRLVGKERVRCVLCCVVVCLSHDLDVCPDFTLMYFIPVAGRRSMCTRHGTRPSLCHPVIHRAHHHPLLSPARPGKEGAFTDRASVSATAGSP
eukprot:m.63779 g.63779  ORF g.63779 m.63779 type:complete len:367 (-) comp12485_c0_seq1:970-2070(-)